MKNLLRANHDAGFVFEDLESRQLLTIVIANPIADLTLNRGAPAGVINLANRYTDASVSNVVRFATNSGNMDIALFGGAAPNTVANFLAYVNAGRYNNTIFHREQVSTTQGIGILQGGGFQTPTATYTTFPPSTAATPQEIPAFAPINLENPTGNTRGTIAMARTNNINSATSSFFFNNANNTGVLDDTTPNVPDSGYAVFGTLLPGSLATLDTLSAFVDSDFSEDFGAAFADLPMRRAPGNGGFVTLPIQPSEYLQITSATVLNGIFGEISVTSSNPNLVTASINNGNLILTPVGTQLGTSTITVRITAFDGTFVEDTFDIAITNAPPAAGGVQAQRNASVGRSMLVSAYGVRDTDLAGGGVGSVSFYHDTNDDGVVSEGDTLLGFDNDVAGGWNLRFDTTGLTAGTNRFFARITDNENATTDTAFTVNLRPAVSAAPITPGESGAAPGQNVDIGLDIEGNASAFRRISIFLDADGNGQFNALNDRLLGHARYTGSAWVFTVNGADLELGSNTIFSRVSDNFGNLGSASSATITVGN